MIYSLSLVNESLHNKKEIDKQTTMLQRQRSIITVDENKNLTTHQ